MAVPKLNAGMGQSQTPSIEGVRINGSHCHGIVTKQPELMRWVRIVNYSLPIDRLAIIVLQTVRSCMYE
jgi:hypothetical protein